MEAADASNNGENMERFLLTNNNHNVQSHNTLSASTDIVHAIFGPSVGPCRAAFTCNYQRIHGRLYLSTRAVLFYSIFFGYERRLCLPLDDITELTTYRTTSIRIEMVDCEVHIFKTLKDRDHVLQLILSLKRSLLLSQQQQQSIPKEVGISLSLQPNNRSYDEDDSTIQDTEETLQENSTVIPTIAAFPLRQRSISLPVVLGSISESPEIMLESTAVRKRSDGDLDSTSTDSQGIHQMAAWEQAKQKKYEEIAIEAVTLPCSLDKFFDMFLADHAPHSLDSFQRNTIGDTEMVVAPWELRRGCDLLVRTTSCQHKLKNSLGPSHAKTTRHQRLQRFGNLGICVESSITVAGVPAADCFIVSDQWLIEAVPGGNVLFSVRFQINFLKRTILKGIIQTSTRTESKQWFASYVKMMQTALSGQDSERVTIRREANVDTLDILQRLDDINGMNQKLQLFGLIGTGIAAILFVALILQTLWLQRSLVLLREDIRRLHLDTTSTCQGVAS